MVLVEYLQVDHREDIPADHTDRLQTDHVDHRQADTNLDESIDVSLQTTELVEMSRRTHAMVIRGYRNKE